jgi:hypothetical protein
LRPRSGSPPSEQRQKVMVALGAHFIWVRSPRHRERNVPRRLPSHACYGPVLGTIAAEGSARDHHHADPLYQHLIITRPKGSFWHRMESGEPPSSESSRRDPGIRIVDMSDSNAWVKFAGIFARTPPTRARAINTELKSSMPEDPRRRSAIASAPSARNPAR